MWNVSDNTVLTITTIILIYSPNLKQHLLHLFIIALQHTKIQHPDIQMLFFLNRLSLEESRVLHIRKANSFLLFSKKLSAQGVSPFILSYIPVCDLVSRASCLLIYHPHFWTGYLYLQWTTVTHLLQRSNTTGFSNPISASTISSFFAPFSCQTKNYKPRQIFELLLRLKQRRCYITRTTVSSNILK